MSSRPASGRSPATQRFSVLSSIFKDTPRSVTDLKPALPREFSRIIKHCLEKAPEYQRAKDLRNDLRELRQDHQLGALDTSQTVTEAAAGAARANAGGGLHPPRSSERERRSQLVGGYRPGVGAQDAQRGPGFTRSPRCAACGTGRDCCMTHQSSASRTSSIRRVSVPITSRRAGIHPA
jgi:hypothetical protein